MQSEKHEPKPIPFHEERENRAVVNAKVEI